MVSLTVNAATNRISTWGFSYDAAGHLVQWPGGTVTISAEYDVDGRIMGTGYTWGAWEPYYYDARNRRVKTGYTRFQFYGLGGELLGEYERVEGRWAPRMVRERVYFAGLWVGTVEGDGSWSMPNTDRLGSLKYGLRRYPFGDGNESYAYDEYATYRKDHASAHYYAWHRYYSATWGRFSSPDPYVMSGGLTNPQGWNRYSYVANDPVNFYDPTGLVAAAPKFDDPTLVCMLGMPYWLSYDYAFVLCSGGGGWGGAGPVTYPSPGVERGGGGSGNAAAGTSFEQAFNIARRAAREIEKKKKWNKDCEKLLTSLGTSSTSIAEAASRVVFIEAPGSTVLYASLYSNTVLAAAAAAQWKATTIGGYIAANPNTKAIAELNGNRVYLNQKWWGGNYNEDLATVMHELVHNITGLTDSDIERILDIEIGKFSTLLRTNCL